MPPPTVTKGTSTTGIPAAATMARVHQSDVRSSWVRSPRPPPPPGAPPPAAPLPAALPPTAPPAACWTGLRAAIVGAASADCSAEPSVAISPPSASPLSGISVTVAREPPLIHRDNSDRSARNAVRKGVAGPERDHVTQSCPDAGTRPPLHNSYTASGCSRNRRLPGSRWGAPLVFCGHI